MIDPARRRTLLGMALILGSAVSAAGMIAILRHASASLHAIEVAFFRSLFGLIALTPLFVRYGLAPLATRRFPLHLLRGVLVAATMLLAFWALAEAELAKALSINFSAPLLASLLAVLLLKEPLRWARMAALAAGIGGVVMIVQPGTAIDFGTGLAMISAMVWACEMLTIKVLVRTESSITTTFYMGLLASPLLLAAALVVWRTPTWTELAWLAALGTLGTISHLGMAQAFKIADMAAVLPLKYTQLVWVAAIGYWLFDEVPAATTWIGAAMIFVAATALTVWEGRKRPTKPGALATG